MDFENGKILSERFNSMEGEPFSGTFDIYNYKEGLTESVEIKKGLRHGKTIYKNENGSIEREFKYKKGVRVN